MRTDDYSKLIPEPHRAAALVGAEAFTFRYVQATDSGYVGNLIGGDQPRSIDIDLAAPAGSGACDCDEFEPGSGCEHLWAALSWLDRLDASGKLPKRKARAEVGLARLRELKRGRRQAIRTPWDRVDTDSDRLTFVLFASSNESSSETALNVRRHSKSAAGSWSAGARVDLSFLDVGSVPDGVDRRLLGLLGYGARGLRGASVEGRDERDRHDLVEDQARLVLREIALAGRLRYADEPSIARPSELRWDGDKAFAIEAAFDEDGRVTVSLVRGTEAIDAEDLLLAMSSGLCVHDDRLIFVTPEDAVPLLVAVARDGALPLGPAAREEFEQYAATLPPGVWKGAADASGPPRPETKEPIPVLNVLVGGSRRPQGARLECEIHFEYGATVEPGPESLDAILECAETGSAIQRSFDAEAERLYEYLAAGGRRTKSHRDLGQDGNIAAKEFLTLSKRLLSQGWRVLADKKPVRSAGSFSASVQSGLDWFELRGGLKFDDQELSFPELLEAAERKVPTVELGDGSQGVLPEDWLRSWGLMGVAERSGDVLRFQKSQGWLLDALVADKPNVQIDEGFQDHRDSLKRFAGIQPLAEPESFQGELRPYQREAQGWFRFLQEMRFGGCLADDMGLGKTVQVLSLLESRRVERLGDGGASVPHRPSMVVAPKSLVFNWIDEAGRFAPELRVIDYTGTGRKRAWAAAPEADLLVTTYGTLRRDAEQLRETPFDYVVLDESTAIKNPGSQAAKAVRRLVCEHRLALSGTPLENHIGELWSLFEFLNPGMLGRSEAFRALSDVGEAAGAGQGASTEAPDIDRIRRAIRPFFLRRTKTEVLTELPPKTEQVLLCEMSKKDRVRYDELKEYYRRELLSENEDQANPAAEASAEAPAFEGDKLNVLEALLRLRQVACHPGLMDPELAGEDSAKLEILLPRVEELSREGHKVLVFSQFTTLLGIVRERLEAKGIRLEYLDGQTTKRKECVDRFQTDPDITVFLISLKAGGHGLNLTSSDYVFILDPWWNPAIESQAIDRAHRMGQTRPVHAYRLISKGTVEERVMELQAKKRALADALFSAGGGVLKDLTREDLEHLLS